MGRGTLKVVMDFEVTGNAESKLKKVRTEAEKTGKGIEKMGKKAGAAAKGGFKDLAGAYNALVVAGRVARAISAGLQPAIKMEQAMTNLSVTTGITGDKLQSLAKAARDAASKTPFDPAEALDAMTNVQLATGQVDSSVKLLLPTLQLANTFLGRDTKKATRVAADFIRGFGMNTEQATLALDKLVVAARFTRTRIDDMTGGFRKFGIVAKMANTNFDDVLKVFTLAQATFRNAESNMTGLQRVVQRFSRPEIQNLFSKFLRIDLFDKATGSLRPLTTIVNEMALAARTNSGQWAKFIDIMSTGAESRAVKPLIAAVATLNNGLRDQEGNLVKNAGVVTEFDRRLLGAGKTLTNMSEQAMKPLGQQLILLGDAIFKLLEAGLRPLIGYLTPLVKLLQWFANGVSFLLNDIPYLSDILSRLVGVILAVSLATGMARMAQWALVAVTQMSAMASAWYTKATEGQAKAHIGAAGAAGVSTAANKVLGKSLVGLRFIAGGVKIAFKAMWKAISGPIGWILIAVEAVSWMWGKLSGSKGSAAEDAAKKQKKMLENQARLMQQTSATQSRGLGKLSNTISAFDTAVTKWKDVMKAKMPVLPKAGLGFVEKNLEKFISGFSLGAREAGIMRREMETVKMVFRKGGRATLAELDQAQVSMSVLGLAMKAVGVPAKTAEKHVKGVVEGIAGFRESSGPLATLLMGVKAGTKEYDKALLNQLSTTQSNIESLKQVEQAGPEAINLLSGLLLNSKQFLSSKGDKAFEELNAQMKITKTMLAEQTAEYKKLDAELGMVAHIRKHPILETIKELAKSGGSAKDKARQARFGGMAGPNSKIPGTDIPSITSFMPPGSAGTASAAAGRTPNQHIATTAMNSSKMVKLLGAISTGIAALGAKDALEPGPTDARDESYNIRGVLINKKTGAASLAK